jgi:hypothetical protein
MSSLFMGQDELDAARIFRTHPAMAAVDAGRGVGDVYRF